jgi:hypothetical protein
MAVAPINSVVYPVSGGMEDWLYAAGWDRGELSTCDGADVVDIRTTHLRRAEDPIASREGVAPLHKTHRTSSSSSTRKKKSSKAYAGSSSSPTIDHTGRRALAGRSSNASADQSENRAVVFLVETSDLKAPTASSLGGSKEVTIRLLLPAEPNVSLHLATD